MATKRDLNNPEVRRLVDRLTPLVKRIARRLMRTLPASVEADDLVQDGMIGLMGAVLRSTRETTGQEFDNYVSQCVRGAMLELVEHQVERPEVGGVGVEEDRLARDGDGMLDPRRLQGDLLDLPDHVLGPAHGGGVGRGSRSPSRARTRPPAR